MSRRADDARRTRRALIGGAAVAGSTVAVFGRALDSAYAQDEPPTEPGGRFSTLGPDVSGLLAVEPDGTDSVHLWSGTSNWSNDPPMRLRISRAGPDPNGGRHFMIAPYEFGMVVEYDGVVECWVDDWSIHNNHQTGGSGPPRFWVGNDDDTGGVMVTATRRDGEEYGEVVSQRFSRASGGDLRFTVRSDGDGWDFRAGPEGQERRAMRIAGTGTVQVRPAAGAPAVEIVDSSATTVFKVTGSGQVYARFNRPEQVWVGAAGPRSEAGIAFGRSGDVRLYRSVAQELRVDGRMVLGGLGVANVQQSGVSGEAALRFPLYDTDGAVLGYVPVYGGP